ncbi:hypothetical protein PSTEL_25860 [Paenibacillus stellifer]|uniref:Chemotaxis protein CheA n=1 Tax=Paenibacillus stellifer TaxID=169760 RepID=A0A089LYQ3_9BACL|nr:chemotaxis protein CheA [Paenibacillus stellifer]AIQ66032.1 hypothetical protein PSTEL_25860 [Paenibacillus stellifer]
MMDLSAYRDIFIEELNEQLERMDQTLLSLERSPSPEYVQTLFRSAHTVKGSSSTMAFGEMSELTHQVEYALEWVRENNAAIGSEFIDLMFRALDAMKTLRDEYIGGGPFSDFSALVSEIRSLISRPSGEMAAAQRKQLVLGPEETLKADEQAAAGRTLLEVRIELAGDCLMKAARYQIVMNRSEDELGTVIASTQPLQGTGATEEEDETYRLFAFVIGTQLEAQALQDKLSGFSDVQSVEVLPFTAGAAAASASSAACIEQSPAPHPAEASAPAQAPSRQAAPSGGEPAKGASQTVRVSVDRLDHLMNLVGELLIDQTSLADLRTEGLRGDPAQALNTIGGVSDHMSRVIKELQDGVMKTRMLPIDQLFSRFPRLVRDLSQKLGKQLDLVIQGGETELDRTIIEELGDPLIHLIRNSADHGIESPEARAAAGKPEKGRISLTSFHEENHVVIMLEDDGKGIDGEIIKASAIRKGLITEEQAVRLTQAEAVNLIFEPGFSTASQVSEVSGRGVGMDIVRSQIGRLNGIIDIDTRPGAGTRFTIRLPLTLAIIKGLLVKVAGRLVIIPMYNVSEIVRISPDDVQSIQGQRAIINHGKIVPLYWLHDKLHYHRTERTAKSIPVVIVKSVEKSAAFGVDEIIGNQEVVIKSLGTYLGKMNHLSGATILGNGSVALILEAPFLVNG